MQPEVFIPSVNHIEAYLTLEPNNLSATYHLLVFSRWIDNGAPDADFIAILFFKMVRNQLPKIFRKFC